jgi:hypothetical protein
MTGFFLAHNIRYTYVSTLTIAAGIGSQIEWVLLTFGLASRTRIVPAGSRGLLTAAAFVGASSC